MTNIKERVRARGDLVSKLRRDLHRIPETAYREKKTSRYVGDYLKTLGLDVKTGIARYGVVASLKGGAPGRTLMIRSDMDALEIVALRASEKNDDKDRAVFRLG